MNKSISPPVSPTAESPYVGLTNYSESDADKFFGREAECALIIGNLRAARLTLLYAESGVGKSSLLRAGVAAQIRALAESDARERGAPRLVPVVFSSWSDQPAGALIAAIAAAIEPFPGGDVELPRHELEAALETAAKATGATLLVILDQFEEYFLYRSRDEGKLADQLARCVNSPELRTNFLISIREDAYAGLGDLFRGRVANIYGNFLHLEYLTRDEARDAIEKPIQRVNELQRGAESYAIEPGLIEAVLSSREIRRTSALTAENGDRSAHTVSEQASQVEATNLQLVMKRLWEEETGAGSCTLRVETLQRLGGAEAIISAHLDRSMATLAPEQQSAAAAVFRFLVTREGTKIALTAATLAEHSGVEESRLDLVLRRLSAGDLHILRPLSPRDGQGKPSYEIFHDALARPIADWRTRKDKAELAEGLEREREAKEEARRHALEAERREAVEKRRKRFALVGLGVAIAALVGVAVVFAIIQSDLAASRKKTSQSIESAERISEVSRRSTFGPGAAALAGTEAYGLSPTFEARNQVLSALQPNAALPKVGAGHTGDVQGVAFFPGSTTLASAGADGAIRLWDSHGRQIGGPLVRPNQAYASYDTIAVSAPLGHERRRVLASHSDGNVSLWDVTHRSRPRYLASIAPASGGFGAVAFDPDRPQLLAVTEPGNAVRLWNVGHPSRPHAFGQSVSAPGHVWGIAFSPDGDLLASAGIGGGRAWAVSGSGFGKRVRPPLPSTSPANAVAIAPDGSWAYGLTSGAIHLYDARHQRSRVLHTAGAVWSVAFARHGSVLVSGGVGRSVTTWDVQTGRPFGPPRVQTGKVESVAVSSDGGTIASGGTDHLVKLWPLDAKRALATTIGGLRPAEAGVPKRVPWINDLSISPSGWVAAAANKGGAFIWKLPSHQAGETAPEPETRIPSAHHDETSAVAYHGDVLAAASGSSFRLWRTGASCNSMPDKACALGPPVRPFGSGHVWTLAFSPSGELLASAGKGGHLNLWNVSDPHMTRHLWKGPLIPGGIERVAFSPTTPLIAVAGDDGTVRLWNVDDPRHPTPVGRPLRFRQAVNALAFSPSGGLLAYGGAGGQIAFAAVQWDPASGEASIRALKTPFVQRDTIDSLAFSPDGKTLAAGDGSMRSCLYDVARRQFIGSSSCLLGIGAAGLSSRTMIVEFAPDGTMLTAGTGNPIVAWNPLLWSRASDAPTVDALRSDSCAIAPGNLTAGQWDEVFAGTDLAADRDRTCKK